MANRICSVEGCGRATGVPGSAKGFCRNHYQRFRRYQDPLGAAPKLPPRVCEIDGCGKPHVGYGYCAAHHRRFKRYGDPLGAAERRTRKPPKTCSIDGCQKPSGKIVGGARGWCNMHYTRWKRWGSPHSLAPQFDKPESCSVEGCSKPYSTAGYCSAHYSNVLRHGEPVPRKRGEVRDERKICSRCRVDLPVSDYRESKSGRVPPACLECDRAQAEARRRKNPEVTRKHARDYTARNLEKRRDYARLRRAMKLSNGDVERVERSVVMQRDGWTCSICGLRILRSRSWPDRLSQSLDHVVPLSMGGSHTYANVAAAHLGCNMAKGGRNRLTPSPQDAFDDEQ